MTQDEDKIKEIYDCLARIQGELKRIYHLLPAVTRTLTELEQAKK